MYYIYYFCDKDFKHSYMLLYVVFLTKLNSNMYFFIINGTNISLILQENFVFHIKKNSNKMFIFVRIRKIFCVINKNIITVYVVLLTTH